MRLIQPMGGREAVAGRRKNAAGLHTQLSPDAALMQVDSLLLGDSFKVHHLDITRFII